MTNNAGLTDLSHQILDKMAGGVYGLHNDTFCYVNEAFATLLGYRVEEMLAGLTLHDILPSEHLEETYKALAIPGKEATPPDFQACTLRRQNGTMVRGIVHCTNLKLDQMEMVIGTVLPGSPHHLWQQTADLTALVYEHSSEGMVITDPDGVIITVNAAFTRITGYTFEEVVNKRLNLLSAGYHDRDFYERMWASILETGHWQGEVWNRRKNGEEYAEHLRISTVFHEDGRPRYRFGIFSDVTEQKIQNDRIWRQANFDFLTGLPNRKLFHERLNQAITQANEEEHSLALLYIDLDEFKEINDAYSHASGDAVLRLVAGRLQRCVRRSDTVARLGGDEFCIILEGVSTNQQARRICDDIMRALEEPYGVGEVLGQVSASIGVAFYPEDASDGAELMNNADLAMYAAKERGRGRYCFYHARKREQVAKQQDYLNSLADAPAKDQLRVYYQPIIDVGTGQLIKAEALVRWQHPQHGLILPNDFIPAAENSGLILEIGDWVFNEVAQQVADWRKRFGKEVCVSINVSPAQLHHQKMQPDHWLSRLQGLTLPGNSITMEITERLLMNATPQVLEKLQALREAGVRVALDDFGTGYSSLPYLRKFYIDQVKIDRTFITNLLSNQDDRTVSRAIISLAHSLGLEVIAEGVETSEQYALLKAMGCDGAQGFLFARPLPASEFVRWLCR